ncbi:MAG: type 4a pilus biogenesis protein PilO [Gemmatimonadota bacterium]
MAFYNPSDPSQRNALIVGVLMLVLLYPFFEWVYAPRREEVTAMQTRLEDLDDQNRRAQILAARGGGDLEERMALYERHVERLEQLIPALEEVPGLVDDINIRARRAGVDVNRILPEPTEPGPFYSRTSYEMSIVGEYHDVARVLTDIASLPRIVTPIELSMQLFQQADLFPEYESPVLASFRIETYVLPEEGAPAPPAAEGVSGG